MVVSTIRLAAAIALLFGINVFLWYVAHQYSWWMFALITTAAEITGPLFIKRRR